MSSSDDSKTKRPPIKWNEQNLKENEKIQEEILRNMREKGQSIDEPKTPYRHDDDDSDSDQFENAFSEEHFTQKLQDTLNERKSEWEDDSENDHHHAASPHKDEEFNRKRKMHYNEYKVLQRMRQRRKIDVENEDDDDEEIQKFLANPPKVIHSK